MKRVAIIGLGESRTDFFKMSNIFKFHVTIGINDVGKYLFPDFLFVTDPPYIFSEERQETIINTCLVQKMYAVSAGWLGIKCKFPIEIIPTESQNTENRGKFNLESLLYGFSFDSAFIAVQIAFKEFKADQIVLFGIDFKTHHLIEYIDEIKTHYKNLADELLKNDCKLYVSSNYSLLSDVLPVFN